MQQALQIQTVIDQAIVQNLPELAPLLGHRVQMIALDLESAFSAEENQEQMTFEQFLYTRPEWPKDKPAITLDEMAEAIAQGACRDADL